jgi:hypothetical protein
VDKDVMVVTAGAFAVLLVLKCKRRRWELEMRNAKEFINVAAATALLFFVTSLVLINVKQVGAQPDEPCLQFAGCSH